MEPNLGKSCSKPSTNVVERAFDAMTTKRPYRNPLTIQDALAEMKKCSGTQFDPEVVEVLSRVVHAMTNSGGVAMLQ